jgi:uroporphyrinogen-III decarboxylase
MKDYKIPPPLILKPEEKAKAEARFEKIKGTYILWGGGVNFFERMQWLRGYEALLIDMAEDREEVYILADRILDEYIIPLVKSYLEIGAEVISLGDDWGTQSQLMISPALWRRIFKPRYKQIFDLCHDADALVYMHSDGMIMEIIPDLIEIGLNVINPQFSCMNLKELKKITDHKICISTDIDRQQVLPFGTPGEVREYVRNVFELLAHPEGGLLWRGEVGPDVPLENVETMLKAFYEFSVKK